MIFTAPMRLLAAVVLDETSEAVSRELLRQGSLDLVSIRELEGDWKNRVDPSPPDSSLVRIGELRKRLEGFFRMYSIPAGLPALALDNAGPLDLAAAEKSLDALSAEVNGIRERQKTAQEEAVRLQEMRRQLELFDDLRKPSGLGSAYSFLVVRTGLVSSTRIPQLEESLESLPSILVPSASAEGPAVGVLLVTLKRDEGGVEPILARAGWEDRILPPEARDDKEEALRGLDARVSALRIRQSELQSELDASFSGKAESLSRLWAGLRVNELLARVRSGFSHTGRTVLFSGWIPRERQAAVEEGIRRAAAGKCYMEWFSPEEGEAKNLKAPVTMRNPGVLKPFEMLVRNYALPEYGTVDPTPFVGVAYLAMFGLMFGDAGHGLVLALLGMAGILRARSNKSDDTLFRLILYCGFSAIVTGALFGSYFGRPWLPPLWFDYHGIVAGRSEAGSGAVRSVYDILGITIRFGLAVMGTGLVLNWVNLIRKRRWLPLLLDKGGLVGGWIYAAGAWVAFSFVGSGYRQLPAPDLLFGILGIPTLALALKGPIEYARHAPGKRKPFGALTLVDFFMEWIVEILEIYSGYLANTLSFMRVAGLGIAHVSLMLAFAQIARMINPDGGSPVAAAAILVLGNALVIALEGLSAGIQSLRLNYYEFFSKYFNGTGRAYKPISLTTKE